MHEVVSIATRRRRTSVHPATIVIAWAVAAALLALAAIAS